MAQHIVSPRQYEEHGKQGKKCHIENRLNVIYAFSLFCLESYMDNVTWVKTKRLKTKVGFFRTLSSVWLYI